MKKTSKKLLSFFLAVVMIVTSCSVGFTAFAEDTQPEAYWSDKNSADDAFSSLTDLVSAFIPVILGIEITQKDDNDQDIKVPLYSVIGMTADQLNDASLSDVVAAVTPMLMKLDVNLAGFNLKALGASEAQKRAIITNHLKKTDASAAYSGLSELYFSYLNDPEAQKNDINFFDLYQLCLDVKDYAGKNQDVADWANETLKVLDSLLNLYDEAKSAVTGANNAYSELTAADSLSDTKIKEKDGVKYEALATAAGTASNNYKNGVEIANKFYKELGIETFDPNATGSDLNPINDPAEALYYYYSVNGKEFANVLSEIALAAKAGKKFSTTPIGGTEDLDVANIIKQLNELLPAYIASNPSIYSKDDFINDNKDVEIKKLQDKDAAEGRDGSANSAEKAKYWPTAKNDYYFTATGSIARITGANTNLVNQNLKKAQNAIIESKLTDAAYLDYISSPDFINDCLNKSMKYFPDMLNACYKDIAVSSEYYSYQSTGYESIVKETLAYSDIYEDLDKAIADNQISDKQITDTAKAYNEYIYNKSTTFDTLKAYADTSSVITTAQKNFIYAMNTLTDDANQPKKNTVVTTLLNINGKTQTSADLVNAVKSINFAESSYNDEAYVQSTFGGDNTALAADFHNYVASIEGSSSDIQDFLLNSGKSTFSEPATVYIRRQVTDAGKLNEIRDAFRSADPVATFKTITLSGLPYTLHSSTSTIALIDAINSMIPSTMVQLLAGVDVLNGEGLVISNYRAAVRPGIVYKEMFIYKNFVKPALDANKVTYKYNKPMTIPGQTETKKVSLPGNIAVKIENDKLNSLIALLFGGGLGVDINAIVGSLLDNKTIDLEKSLTDILLNLYTAPIETIFTLIPVLATALDELLVPILFSTDDCQYNNLLGGLVYNINGGKLGLKDGDKTVGDKGDTSAGINQLSFDLGKMLPSILYSLLGNKDKAIEIVGTYAEPQSGKSYKFDEFTFLAKTDDKGNITKAEETVKAADIPYYTGILVADHALANAKISDLKKNYVDSKMKETVKDDKGVEKPKYTEKDRADLEATGQMLVEMVTELATFGLEAVNDYITKSSTEEYVRYSAAEGSKLTAGINNIFIALPELIDTIGKKFVNKYGIASWEYCFDGKITDITDDHGNNAKRNQTLESLKYAITDDTASSKDQSAMVLNVFANVFIEHQLNALLDLVNKMFTDSNNTFTKNLPVVYGLIEALGGFGEDSIITDLINGLFQLKRSDDASFTLKKRPTTGYVGFSPENALFLISNLFIPKSNPTATIDNVVITTTADMSEADKLTQKRLMVIAQNNTGIVPLVLLLIKGQDNKAEETQQTTTDPNTQTGTAPTSPYLVLSSETVDYKSVLTSSNEKAAKKIVSALDQILASLLKNTTLNGFDFTKTDSILSGVVLTVANYIGEKNTNEILQLVNSYLEVIVDDNRSSKNGAVDASKVYTSKNLSSLVISTYSLIEGIAETLLYGSKGALKYKDPNKIIVGAIEGIISPDAVQNRMSDSYKNTKDALTGKKVTNWTSLKDVQNGKVVCQDLKYGFSNGDKKGFYNALGESLNGIAAILGALLTYSYSDLNADKATAANLYSGVLYPVLTKIADATGAKGVMAPQAFNAASNTDKLISGIITPLSSILDQLYSKPATFIVNLVVGLAGIVEDNTFKSVVNGALGSINAIFTGAGNIVTNLSPTLVTIINKAIGDTFNLKLADKNTLATLITGIEISKGVKLSAYVDIKGLDWNKLAKAGSPEKALLIVYAYLVDNVLGSPFIMGLIESLSPELAKIIKTLSAGQILKVLAAVLSVTQSPTEIYWTFNEYAGKIANTFVYPRGINNSQANSAVDKLDTAVTSVFSLLKDLGVADIDGLDGLINDNLYTNEILTTLATTLYGALTSNADVNKYLGQLGYDFSPAGFANTYLMDKSYGKTYSTAAKKLKKAKSWKKVKNLNWGFTNGTQKAQTGFINGLAAILRPLNNVLAVFLAEGKLNIAAPDLMNVIKSIDYTTSTGIEDTKAMGCKLNITIKGGVLKLVVDSNDSTTDSTLKVDLAAVVEALYGTLDSTELSIGTNGYENAVIPLLEAFMCKDVKTYKQYKADYKKAKDNLLIDILNPIAGLINDVATKPFDTVTKILPNVAYFIDSNGLMQAISNLLAPVTKGVLGALSDNGLDVDKLIKAITGKTLGKVITDALDINVKLNVELGHLEKCNVQDILVPLINKLLKNAKLGIVVPKFTFAEIASHGTIKVVKSAAKNDKGKYTTRIVEANQGEVLVAVLRYVSNVLIKNATAIKKLLVNIDAIKKNKTIANIIGAVFDQIKTASADDIVRAIFYFLNNQPVDSFFDYSGFKYQEGGTFTFGDLDEDFCRQLAPMLDGLINGLVADGLNGLIGGLIYKDDIISSLATGLYGAIEGVSLGDMGSLTKLLAHFDLDFSTANVAKLLTDEAYGKSFDSAASVIKKAGSWSKVNKDSLNWGVTDRQSFEYALCAVLRPIYGVLDVFLNDGLLNLANIVSLPGSDCYTSVIVPLLEAFSCYNVKTQYQYRQDMSVAYDAILLDILDPLLDKVEDILNAPIEMVADILPNLALFFANDGLLQIIDNLLTPISAVLDALRPVVDVNAVLKAAGLDLNKLLASTGLNLNIKLDIYDLKGTLEPLIGADNVVALLNKILGIIKIGGAKLGIVLPEINWFELASHGTVVKNEPSQAATIGGRIYVIADQDETLISVLRFLIDTINYGDNYDAIVGLIGGLLGDGVSDSISGVIDQVLGMLQGDSDEVIKELVDLLQSIAG